MRSSCCYPLVFLLALAGHLGVGAFSVLPRATHGIRTRQTATHLIQGNSLMVESRGSSTTTVLFHRRVPKQDDDVTDETLVQPSRQHLQQQHTQPLNYGNPHHKLRLGASLALATAAFVALPQYSLATTDATLAAVTSSTSSLLDSLSQTGFYQAFSLVFLSEIGDKTFFIAGLLAMKTSRLVSYLGSMGALAAMTILSVIIGQLFHAVPAGIARGIPLDDVAAVLAFAFFGFITLKDALEVTDGESTMDEELADAEETVAGSNTIKQATAWAQILSTFGLVFAAEFGDRSFLSTIALSAAQNPISVAGGAIAAHGVATGIAVAGGSYVAKYISEKVIGVISGTLFLVFALTTALGIF